MSFLPAPQFDAHQLSDAIFTSAIKVVVSRADTALALGQRKWLLARIREAVIADGKVLVSQSDETTFSKHGSLFHRLRVPGSTDIDVYVGLNGSQLSFGNQPLTGRPSEPNNLLAFQLPLQAAAAAVWMFGIVQTVLRVHNAHNKVELGQRGAVIKAYGRHKRDYDIIPAFVFTKDGHVHHVIPNKQVWEVNPTARDMRVVIDLNAQFSRDSSRKVLGYRDLVKVLKRLKDILNWKATHGITSFMIRHAVGLTLEESSSRFNQKQLAAAVGQLQLWLDNSLFPDPYAADKQLPDGKKLAPLNERMTAELSPALSDALLALNA